ncbi:hypothetical protein Clacol_009359 [Clathrus columnatus]|uniref:mRNA cap guanine-N(7) methyltransferase n=1 Tax=Clathrus columnatus TaxID=1419009 RepID=A0AAV5AQV0_9AGAM|nr:hypothetical protein Clacol_009359 [Clathrus columnatus]
MPRGYDALRDVLASNSNSPISPTLTRPHISNILNDPISPTSMSSSSIASQPPAPPPPQSIPYNPTKRFTPPASVLIPLTLEEFESFKIPRNALRVLAQRPDPALENPNFFPPNIANAKRKREDDDESGSQKRSRDSGLVVHHYNSRPDVGVHERRESPIIGLKNFNNWIKSVLIAKFAKRAFEGAPPPPPGDLKSRGKVLDMGCGKGGDLQKWQKARVREYVGLDIAAVSVEQARFRWEQLRGKKFAAHFAALDCFVEPIASVIPSATLIPPFDVVSMQFCMHYAFENETKARIMLDNVSKYLRKGGVFLGTVPNGEWIMNRLSPLSPTSEPAFGNSVYRLTFEEHLKKRKYPTFGHRYTFFLKDAVENVPEYVVHWDHFTKLAEEYSLYSIYREEFHDIFQSEREDKEFGALLQRMKVVDSRGVSQMDEDQWEAANIYLGFAFEKR